MVAAPRLSTSESRVNVASVLTAKSATNGNASVSGFSSACDGLSAMIVARSADRVDGSDDGDPVVERPARPATGQVAAMAPVSASPA